MQLLPCTIETVFIPTVTTSAQQQPIFSVASNNNSKLPAPVVQKVEDEAQNISYIIKLERMSIVQAISFKKTQKPNTTNTKTFQIFGGLDKANMPLLLNSCTLIYLHCYANQIIFFKLSSFAKR